MTFVRVFLTGTILLAFGLDLQADETQSSATKRPFGPDAGLSSAIAKVPRLRQELFTRETIRENNKQIIRNVIDNETRSAAAAGMRGGL